MYKLTYFDETIRAEPARLLMAAAGVKFDDVRVKENDWPAMKPSIEWGQLPILEVGDKTLAQSNAIFRYLAREFNLVGADNWEAAKCDELVGAIGDLIEEYIIVAWYTDDPAKKEERKNKMATETFPTFLKRANKALTQNGGNWLVGKNMTYADIVVAEFIKQLDEFVPGSLSEYPSLKKLLETVYAQKGIKEYKAAAASKKE